MRPYSTAWYITLSTYWFATSFKWFLVLLVLLPARVAELVDPAEKATRLGFLFAVGAVMAFVGPPVFGYVSDRFPTRWGKRLLTEEFYTRLSPVYAFYSLITVAVSALAAFFFPALRARRLRPSEALRWD